MFRRFMLCAAALALAVLFSCARADDLTSNKSDTSDAPEGVSSEPVETEDAVTTETAPQKNIVKEFYIYKSESNYTKKPYYYTVNEAKIEFEGEPYAELFGTFGCEHADAFYAAWNMQYILFNDGGWLLYDVETGETVKLDIDTSKTADYRYGNIVFDYLSDKPTAIIFHESDDKSALFSLESGKLVTDLEYNFDTVSYNGKIIAYSEKYDGESYTFGSHIYNIADFALIAEFEGSMAGRYKGDALYFALYAGRFADYGWFKLYSGDYKLLSDKYYFYSGITDDGNILLVGGSDGIDYTAKNHNFIMLDRDGKTVYVSRDYDETLYVWDEYVCVNDDGMLKLIDKAENVKTVFGEWNDDMHMHTMISHYMRKNMFKKDDYYKNIYKIKIVGGKPEYTPLEAPIELPGALYIICENMKIASGTEGRGIEYYYVPETGETGMITLIEIGGYAKPVLYLYPEEETAVSVAFEHPEYLTVTYPAYPSDGWRTNASPGGTLTDARGRSYYALYWEESGYIPADFSTGFCVTRENAAGFLEEKLGALGFTERESNEFIMYWLPILQKNGISLVHFELTESREAYNRLNISPAPDSLLRVAIHIKKINAPVAVAPQVLPQFERAGFAAVEWGGVAE